MSPNDLSLFLQLKILKELMILNKNIRVIVRDKVGRNDAYSHLYSSDMDDVQDVLDKLGIDNI